MQDIDGKMKWSYEQGNILYQKAIEMLNNKISMRDIAEELDIGKSTIGRWKAKAQGEGLI